MFTWDEMDYWQSGEWQVVEDRLSDMDKAGAWYNPAREDMFEALDRIDFAKTKVCIVGQDPYPNRIHATGVAFEVPSSIKVLPPTLVNIFEEYHKDLGYPVPTKGSLRKWTKQGVLLWNAYPSCAAGRPGSHHWDEWTWLTKEILEKLDQRSEGSCVFVFLGGEARKFAKFVTQSDVIETSHPSRLGVNHGFKGSRLFSTINQHLVEAGDSPIDWKLG